MSSVRFDGEGENVGAGSRSRRKRRTSILKQSPSRTALGDLDTNTTEQKEKDVKSKRRSSKRVSFADTLRVQEFWTEHHAKELGLWDSSHDSIHVAGEQSGDKDKSVVSVVDGQDLPSVARLENQIGVCGDQKEQEQDLLPAENHEHKISGLETLLTGQIRNAEIPESQPQGQAISSIKDVPLASEPLSTVQKNVGNDIAQQQTEHIESQLIEACPEFNVEDATVSKSVSKKHARRSLTLVGSPSYLRRMPSNNSSVSMDQTQWATAQQSSLNASQGAADMDLTSTSISAQPENKSPLEQTDNQSFFQEFLKLNEPAVSVQDEPADDNVFVDEDEKTDNRLFFQQLLSNRPKNEFGQLEEKAVQDEGALEKMDNQSFFSTLMGSSSSQQKANVLSQEKAIPDERQMEKMDNQSFFSSLMGSSSSQQKANVSSTVSFNKTVIYDGDDTAAAGMEMTTCIGGIQPNERAPLPNHDTSRRPLGERIQALASSDMTVRFDDQDNEGDMEMTKCYNGDQQINTESTCTQRVTEKADATQIFNQSGAMELTTCVGGVSGNNLTRYTNVSGLSFMKKTFTNVTLDNTTAILREIDSAFGLKRKSDVPVESIQDGPVQKMRKGEHGEGPAHESTRVFSGAFVPAVNKKHCSQVPLALSPIKKDANDINGCGEETAAIELTGCVTDIQKRQPSDHPAKSEHGEGPAHESTRVFSGAFVPAVVNKKNCSQLPLALSPIKKDANDINGCGEETAAIELTGCVTDIQKRQPSDHPAESTRIVQADVVANMKMQADGRGDRSRVFEGGSMEMTDCYSVRVTGAMPSSSAAKVELKTSKMANEHERTKIFQLDKTCGMELTTCMDNVIGKNSSSRNKELTLNDTQQRKTTDNMDKTKIFQSDETCGMEFTTCVGDLLPKTQSINIQHETGNRTRVLSEEVDMTECMDSYVTAPNTSKSASGNVSHQATTKTFSGSTAEVDSVLPIRNVSTSLESRLDKENLHTEMPSSTDLPYFVRKIV